jgi:hypothetical protein
MTQTPDKTVQISDHYIKKKRSDLKSDLRQFNVPIT